MDTLICNVTAVTMDERMQVLFGAFIGIDKGKITYLGKEAPAEKPDTIIDGTGMVAIPGLVNCHTHLATTALRSYLDETSRVDTLKTLLEKEAKLDEQSAEASAVLGIAECLRFGITSLSDLGVFPQAVAKAAAESGIKANVAMACYRFIDENEDFDFDTDPVCKQLQECVDAWHGHDDGRVKVDAGIYAEYTGNYKLWEALSDYSREKGLSMQLHLSETLEEAQDCEERTGLTQTELLNCHRFFSQGATATGCAYLTEQDRAILRKRQVSCVTTPNAYAKAGRKPGDISVNVKAGLNVALGTGGSAECGSMDLFEVMRQAAYHQRQLADAPEAMPAQALLMMATVCGARAQGRSEETGMLKVGLDADMALVDFSAPHLIPCHNVMSSLVFSAKGGDVAMTMVRGKVLYQNGQFPTLDISRAVQTIMEHTIPRLFAESK